MEDGHSQGPAKRPRLDAPVESLLNPMSATALDSNLISYCNIAQSVPQTGILDPGPWPSAIHAVYPSQQNDYHPSKHHGELAMPQNDFHGIVPGDVFGHSLTGLENHTLDTGEWVRQFERFQCMVSAEEMSLSIPNPPTTDHEGALNGSTIEENTVICFGMCAGIPGECEVSIRCDPTPLSSQLAVNLETAREFTCPSVAGLKGSISTQYGQLLQAILDETSVKIQVTCTLDEQNIGVRKSGGLLPQLIPCSLSITLYGPKELFEELGTFFQDYDIYLQDPLNCDMNVRYCNPHRLSSMELSLCPMTYDLKTNILESFDIQAVSHHSELLDMLDPQEDLSEAVQPSEIQTQLEKHQKQALNFMLQREQGWAFDSSRGDLWGWKKAIRGRLGESFINMVSGDHQLEEPRQFFGGIIADPMGLGKTLTMISLVAANVREYHAGNFGLEESTGKLETNKTTLVVVPPPLLDTWEEQLSEHVVPGGLSWCRHHGKSRLLDLSELKRRDIILTTYHTISAEWKNGKQEDQSILFSTRWKRLILDEAHFIRNSSSQMAKAICSVPAVARWAVTGTPIQNRLGDLAALFKFLGVDPYGDIKRFDADITHLWKTGESKQAVERLKRLSRCLILRRPKTTINLPARRDLRCPVNFASDERTLYENIKSQAIAHFAEATTNHDGGETSQSIKFVNVIQQINTLRMICNLGLHYSTRHDIKPTEYQNNSSDVLDWSSIAQQAFNFQCEITSIICQRCKSSLDITERLFSGSGNHFVNSPLFSQCLRFICSDCVQHSRGEYSCGHNPPHLFAPVSLNGSILEESILIPAHLAVRGGVTSTTLPSKVTSLLKQLRAQPSDVKSVVFSTWRMTLDVVESGLKQAQIPCLRYDGKVPQKERQSIIEKFRNDPTIPVLLLTLSCGAVGLTLTEASYAYLMEPHWNPTVEEQALARIHRLGQKKEVTTIRFYIKDTFEERVMEVQRSKEDLAGTLFSSDNNTQSGNASRLERLCSLL